MLVFLAVFAVASIQIYNWFDADLFTALMIVLPLPLVLIAERIWTKRQDWVLTHKEFAEDVFWLAGAVFIWYPFYTDYYQTPISEEFKAVRDSLPLGFTIEPTSVLGLVFAAIMVRTLIEFIYYWLHRAQHSTVLCSGGVSTRPIITSLKWEQRGLIAAILWSF